MMVAVLACEVRMRVGVMVMAAARVRVRSVRMLVRRVMGRGGRRWWRLDARGLLDRVALRR